MTMPGFGSRSRPRRSASRGRCRPPSNTRRIWWSPPVPSSPPTRVRPRLNLRSGSSRCGHKRATRSCSASGRWPSCAMPTSMPSRRDWRPIRRCPCRPRVNSPSIRRECARSTAFCMQSCRSHPRMRRRRRRRRHRSESTTAPAASARCSWRPADSGTSSILAVPDVGGTMFAIQTPIYSGGQVPDSVPARQAAYLGSLGTSIAPNVLLSAVSRDDSDFTITLTHDGVPSASFSDGEVPTDAESVREDLGNGWSATISRPTPDRGLMASDSAKGLLAAGIAASVMLGLLIYALGTGRRRAIRLVASRTDELRYQALHDSLTGLPNRAMILDRVEQLLARSLRNGTSRALRSTSMSTRSRMSTTPSATTPAISCCDRSLPG